MKAGLVSFPCQRMVDWWSCGKLSVSGLDRAIRMSGQEHQGLTLGLEESIRALRNGGYSGPFSFEQFAESVHRAANMAYLDKEAFR